MTDTQLYAAVNRAVIVRRANMRFESRYKNITRHICVCLFTFYNGYVILEILHNIKSRNNIKQTVGKMEKKVIYSAVQPTSQLTLGNYLGAVNNWLKFQKEEENDCIFAVADLHSLTIRREAEEVRSSTLSLLAQFLAFGLDEKKNILYVQSHVPAHTQLSWILNCYTYVGEMTRMTQFKDKSAKHADNVNMGLMDYPVLMASDILLYDTDLVPVGVDQVQHLEITRDIAIRFNNIYGETFKVPQAKLGKAGAKIKFKRAVTDSESVIAYDPEKKPGVSNLLTILAVAENTTPEEAAKECEGLMYGHLKLRVAEAVSSMLKPVREEYSKLISDKAYLMGIAAEGAARAAERAEKVLRRAQNAVGLLVE